MSPGDRFADVMRFIARPTPCFVRPLWGKGLALALIAVFLFDLAIDGLVGWGIELLDHRADFLPMPLEEDITLAEDLFFSLLMAPVLEEALYRGWMTGRIAALRFAAFGAAAAGCLGLSLLVAEAWAMPLALMGAGIALVGFVQWLQTRGTDTAVPAWFTRHFHWLVWGSSIAFGLIHLGNYEALTHPLGVLVIAPQLIGGLFLAYVRTRLGLRAAMVHHAAYNALIMVLEYYA
ncbi:MAG: CPBP family glutamic-type intramembrane protease [Erythrobacter sp.]